MVFSDDNNIPARRDVAAAAAEPGVGEMSGKLIVKYSSSS